MSEPDISRLMTVAQAIAAIDAEPVSPRIIERPLDQADGFVLAQEIRTDRDYPPFDKSQMDGFAVRCADASSAGVELRVVDQIAAGDWPERQVRSGEAIAIMTGAPMPPGADGVVPVEDVQRVGERIRIAHPPTKGRFIARRGSDSPANAIVLGSGTTLGPAQLAVAASVGAAKINVYAQPTAAILATGDELVPFDHTPADAQIRNSNNLMLVSLLNRLGCKVHDLGIVPDDPPQISSALRSGLAHDILFITGGMSMGDYDYVPKLLLDLGAELRITRLRIKPGKPFVFATAAPHAGAERGAAPDSSFDNRYPRQTFIFGLPGNPLSGYVCVVRLASRLISRLRGAPIVERWLDAPLASTLPPNGPREFYQPIHLHDGIVHPLDWKGSADLYTLAKSNALLVRPENDPAKKAGDLVRILETPQ